MLLCASYEHPTHIVNEPTTMVRTGGSFAVQRIDESAAPRPTGTIFPLVVYTCTVCGYVELYSGLEIEPEKWAG